MAVSDNPTDARRVRRARVTREEPDWPSNVFVALERNAAGKLMITANPILAEMIAEFIASCRPAAPGESPAEPALSEASIEERTEKGWNLLTAFLAARGHAVERVDVADHQLTAVIDLDTGRAVGEVTNLVEGIDGGDLGKKVFASIESAFDSIVTDLCALASETLSTAGHDAAAATLLADERVKLLSAAPKTAPLVRVLAEIDPQLVDATRRTELVRLRMGLALRQRAWGTARPDIEYLLAHDPDLTDRERETLRIALGNAAAESKLEETAYDTWRRIATDAGANTSSRAWAYKNLTTLLPPSNPDREAFADLAAGLFATVGDRKSVAQCRLVGAESAATRDPQRALALLEQVCVGLEGDDLSSRQLRGGALLERALLELRLGGRELAYGHLVEAADTLRGVFGATGALQNALVILQTIGPEFGHDVDAIAREEEALARELFGAGFELRIRMAALQKRFDPSEATTLEGLLSAPEHALLRATLDVVRAMNDPALNDAERIALMERAAVHERKSQERPLVALPGLANRLLAAGNDERALAVYREILAIDPFEQVARQNVAALLMQLGRYDEAVTYFEQQRATWGERPGILLALGDALLGKGEESRAATVFASVMAMEFLNDEHRTNAQRGFRSAQERGGTVQSVAVLTAARPVTVREWEEALADFAVHVKTEARLHLWRPHGPEKKWVAQPEKVAGQMLRTFLSGKLGPRMESFSELDAGAGRIDLFVILEGGLRMIVELKMLGHGYSSTYAFSGTEQITHYMDNRTSRLGYLVIFDARVDTWGDTPATHAMMPNDVSVTFVDVRPNVK